MAEAKVYLQTVEQRLQAGDLARLKLRVTSSVLVDTDVAAGLIGTAENNQEMDEMGAFNDGDAIAMTTHGRSGLERWVLGSVTERVLGATRLPLLIARPPREATTPEKAGKATKPDESSSSKKTTRAGGWSGNVLFSHRAAPAVSSEPEGLTAVFGMGTGVSLPL